MEAVEDNNLKLWTFRHFYLVDLTRRNSSSTLSISTLSSTASRRSSCLRSCYEGEPEQRAA